MEFQPFQAAVGGHSRGQSHGYPHRLGARPCARVQDVSRRFPLSGSASLELCEHSLEGSKTGAVRAKAQPDLSAEAEVLSFWGHANTLAAAEAILGFDRTPGEQRPALRLNEAQLPVLRKGDTEVAFSEVWVLSPTYAPGYRPEIGAEVPIDKIIAWQVLRITFEPES